MTVKQKETIKSKEVIIKEEANLIKSFAKELQHLVHNSIRDHKHLMAIMEAYDELAVENKKLKENKEGVK